MPSIKALEEQGRALVAKQHELLDDERPWSEKSEEFSRIDADFKAVSEQRAALLSVADAVKSFGTLEGDEDDEDVRDFGAKSIGEHFVKSGMFEKVAAMKGSGERFSVSGPEYKAATDPLVTTGQGLYPNQFGPPVQLLYRQLTIADLLASGTMSGPGLTYPVQGAVTGAYTTVAEGGAKPALNFGFTPTSESLRKIAGRTKVSDETTEDAPAMVSIVQSQLLTLLGLAEEDQILNGNGTAPNIRGLLNRSGIQTYSTPATSTPLKTMNGLFHALMLVKTNSFLAADGLVINPTDYENVRLGVDGQNQFYGGGPFTGAYGNSGLSQQPGLWGLNTVVTPAIAAGTVLVGAFRASSQLFRKGGIRLESTNSNEDDFNNNLISIRAEERVLLAVYRPAALVKVTITA